MRPPKRVVGRSARASLGGLALAVGFGGLVGCVVPQPPLPEVPYVFTNTPCPSPNWTLRNQTAYPMRIDFIGVSTPPSPADVTADLNPIPPNTTAHLTAHDVDRFSIWYTLVGGPPPTPGPSPTATVSPSIYAV